VVGRHWEFQSPLTDLNAQLMIGLLLIFMAVLVLTAVAIAASTRLGQLMTLLICAGVFMFGLVSQFMLGAKAAGRPLVGMLYRLTPNFQFLWPADALTQGHDFSPAYVGMAVGYSVLMIAGILCLAITLFQTREVG